MQRTTLRLLRVRRCTLERSRGRLVAGPLVIACALGRGGLARLKREGDGATPVGRFRLIGAFYRPDRVRRPRCRLPLRLIRPGDGWCDDPLDRLYNRPVRLPYPARCEALWRDDPVYDVVLDLSWNRGPIVKGRGSAIFLHLAQPGFASTAGCVAVERRALARLLERIGPDTRIEIMG